MSLHRAGFWYGPSVMRRGMTRSRVLSAGTFAIALIAIEACEPTSILLAEKRATGGATTGGQAGVDTSGAPSIGGAPLSVPTAPLFEEPQIVEGINDPKAKDQDPSLTEDLLEIFFFSDRAGTQDLFVAKRTSSAKKFGTPSAIAELNVENENEFNPFIARDGLEIWFCSTREPAGIYHSSRKSRTEPFGVPEFVSLDTLGQPGGVIAPSLTSDHLRMAISIGAAATRNVYETTRASISDAWATPVVVPGVGANSAESTPFLIGPGFEFLFASARTGGGDLFWAHRPKLGSAVDRIAPLDALNDRTSFESHPYLSVDGSVIFFGSSRSGGTDIYFAKRIAEAL